MSKRAAATDLNHENWNKEEPAEDPGFFKTATSEVIQKRHIRSARRRIGNSPITTPTMEERKAFGGIILNSNNQSSEPPKPNFSFLLNTNGMSKQPSPFTKGVSLENKDNLLKRPNGDTEKVEEKSSIYFSKLKKLNESVVDWISLHVKKDPHCILTPVFKDYECHLEGIKNEENKPKAENISSPSSSSGDSSKEKTFTVPSSVASNPLNTFTLFTPTANPHTTKSSEKLGENQIKSNIFGNSPLTGFSFTGGKSFTFGNVTAPPKESNEKKNEAEENEDPPKNEFKPVTEEDAVFSQRVKLFVKKDGTFSDRGVGMFYIKPASGKYQAIMRADTSLGNILLNILLTESVPSQRVGKNNVMMVCILTPDTKPPPLPILLRVKTEKEADDLLEKIEKYKK